MTNDNDMPTVVQRYKVVHIVQTALKNACGGEMMKRKADAWPSGNVRRVGNKSYYNAINWLRVDPENRVVEEVFMFFFAM